MQFFTAVISQAKNAFEDDATISNVFVLHDNQFKERPQIGDWKQDLPFLRFEGI